MLQGQTPGLPRAQPTEGGLPAAVTEERVREELNRVLLSHEFRTSKRSQDFLRYVVENTLKGHADILKERTIGIDVFGRSTSYDPSDDATVRVKAGEVRKRLVMFYSGQGVKDPVRIELPSGTYVPEFRENAMVEGTAPEIRSPASLLETPAPITPARPRPGRKLITAPRGLAAGGILIAIAALVWFEARSPLTPIEEFWAPVLKGSSPVLVCAAFVPVWRLDRDPDSKRPAEMNDFVSLTDQFVGGGDLIATSRLTAMLTHLRRPYRLKVGSDVNFADLRTGPAILVGYSYTRWKEISSQMRYSIDGSDSPAHPKSILDSGKPTQWALPHLARDRRTDEDYAIVSRVFHPDTHAMLMEIAGILQYGTDAGSDFVTNPDLMAEALHGAPAGWQQKNVQFVLHVKVISGAPSSPKVVARYFW